jgi:hypothetical protein
VRKKIITSMIYRKTIELEIMKLTIGIFSGLRRITNWTLQNRKRDFAWSKSRIRGSTGHSMNYSPHCVERERLSD